MLERGPVPNDVLAERQLLGALLLGDPDACEESRDGLLEQDFYAANHQLVFGACKALMARGQRPDSVLVRGELQLAGRLTTPVDECLLSLGNILPTSPAEGLVERLRELSVARSLIEAALRVAAEGRAGIDDLTDWLDSSQRRLLSACERRADSVDVQSLGQAVGGAIEALTQRAGSPDKLLGESFGIKALDRQTAGMCGGEVWVVAGRPGMGKSAFAQHAARTVAESGKGVIVFSLEMQSANWAQRMLAAGAPLDVKSVRTGERINPIQWQKLMTEAERMTELPLWIAATAAITPMGVRRIARRQHAKKPLGLVVVDYLQLMRADGRPDSRELQVAECSRALKALAMELNIPVMVLSQLNRGVESRSDKRPMLSDLRESGAIEQDADGAIFLYRDKVYNAQTEHPALVELIIGKQRNGPVGTVKAIFAEEYTRFSDLAYGDDES